MWFAPGAPEARQKPEGKGYDGHWNTDRYIQLECIESEVPGAGDVGRVPPFQNTALEERLSKEGRHVSQGT
jgi:hypothetical protein